MTPIDQIVCEFCSTINTSDIGTCIACGAPLPERSHHTPEKPAPMVIDLSEGILKNKDVNELVDEVDDVYFTIKKTYSTAWRTAGEAVAIIVSSLIIGITAGSAGLGPWGVLGAILVGIAVGLTRKKFLMALVSAPAGAMVGLFTGAFFWTRGYSAVIVFAEVGFAVVGAVLGGSRNLEGKDLNWWEKARPFLGGAGGFAFGLLGVVIGIGIRKLPLLGL